MQKIEQILKKETKMEPRKTGKIQNPENSEN